ncbi:MAG: hypothetical protein V3V99_14675 [candidate division Zixibacteria bacterium]
MYKNLLALFLIGILALGGCSSKPNTDQDPRKVVIKFFGAMEENDDTALAHYIDFERMMKPQSADYALSGDTARNFKFPTEIIDDLMDGGLTKQRWFSMQRIVNNAEDFGDSATVEVSFINPTTNTQYLTKFGLRKINDIWKIYSFNVRDGE